MPFWRDRPEEVRKLAVRRIIVLAGDGVLLDGSECSNEFRTFLSEVEADDLARYVSECLDPGDPSVRRGRRGFDGSGLVLQDVVNEIGRRLDYTVTDGVYSGRVGKVGYDGIWRDGSGSSVIVEVKTTDTYSIPLDTVDGYRRRLVADGQVEEGSSVLFVVGRDDTGALEAQIRGSPHAWTMRMIGAASLVRLLQVKVNSEAPGVVQRVRSVLRPIEYTRLDGIVDLLFDVHADVVSDPAETQAEDVVVEPPRKASRAPSSQPASGLEDFRLQVAVAISDAAGVRLTKRRRSWFESADGATRAIVAVSKRYQRDYQSYWYGVYDTQRQFLAEGSRSFVALCAQDTHRIWSVPFDVFENLAETMNVTVRPDGQTYAHVLTKLSGDTCLLVTQSGEFDLAPYEITAD